MITHKFPFAQAERAYELVTNNTEPHLGVILEYGTAARAKSPGLRIPAVTSSGKIRAEKMHCLALLVPVICPHSPAT